MKKRKVPTDANQRAKSIVDLTTDISESSDAGKNQAAVALGRLGGLKGGRVRAERLSKEERSEIAKKAAAARWKKND